MVEKRKRIRHQDRRAHPLHGTRGDQNAGRRRHGAAQRRGGENYKTSHEDVLGAESVAQGASSQDERRKRDRIGADYPLQFGHVAAKRSANAVERRIDDGDIKLDDAVTEAHRGKCEEFRRSRWRNRVHGCRILLRNDNPDMGGHRSQDPPDFCIAVHLKRRSSREPSDTTFAVMHESACGT